MNALTASQLLTADELATRWQVPKAHVYRLAREGQIPTVTLGRYRRFRAGDVAEFEQAGGTSSADKAVYAEAQGR